jgi:peptide/nickel transport system substrate-binding protein
MGYRERSEFSALVAAGKLPPVSERIGLDPLVVRSVDGIGAYGGVLRIAYRPENVYEYARVVTGPDCLLHWDQAGGAPVPNIARSFEMSEDRTELILRLRRGMRWSDGAPFTADDILFWRDDMSLNRAFSRGAPSLRVDGRDVLVERIDDVTVRFRCHVPNPLLPSLLASAFARDIGGQTWGGGGRFGGGGFAPKHYLAQFHPAYTSEHVANRMAREAGFSSWVEHLIDRNSWHLNPDLPTVTPWITTRPATNPPWRLAANPYSVWVDTEGSQLPYIAEVTMRPVEDLRELTRVATAGGLDFQDRGLEVSQLPQLENGQGSGGYRIRRAPRLGMDFGLRINLAYDAQPVIGDLLRTVEFRRALSLGIDRQAINDAFFLGTSVPSATMVADTSPYFPGEAWRTRWATYDPEVAKRLLDEVGLLAVDEEGYRLRPDGRGRIRLDYHALTLFGDWPAIGRMIQRQWSDIGIDLNVVEVSGHAFTDLLETGAIMLLAHTVGTDDPFLAAGGLILHESGVAANVIGLPYIRWYTTGGREGIEPPESLRVLKEATEMYRAGVRASDAERSEIGKELYRRHADQVWSIGVLGRGLSLNGLCLASDDLRNVPSHIVGADYQRVPANLVPATLYYASSSGASR